ncbi:hypothetical protein F2Y18_24805, partial [Bacillus cereus]
MKKRIKRKNYQIEKEGEQIQKDRLSYLQDTAWIFTILTGAIYGMSTLDWTIFIRSVSYIP